MAGIVGRISAGLAERWASAWSLLSDTTNYLSRTSILDQYEAELAEMRLRLSSKGRDESVLRAVKKELVEMRAALRSQGYDLSLGSLDLSIQGFRNDASMAEGFRRVVLFIGKRQIWFLDGDANHIELHRYLERRLEGTSAEILEKHYLWYRWNHGQLILSGADTESREGFETLKVWCSNPERRLHLIGRLKSLK